jgi:hypothetical protein
MTGRPRHPESRMATKTHFPAALSHNPSAQQVLIQATDVGPTGRTRARLNTPLLPLLLFAIEETSEDWQRAFQDEWGTLEVSYALALDHGDPVLPDASVSELRQAAENK